MFRYALLLIGLLTASISSSHARVKQRLVGQSIEITDGTYRKRVELLRPDIVRVRFAPDGVLRDSETGVCTAVGQKTALRATAPGQYVTDSLLLSVDAESGALSVSHRDGRPLFAELNAAPLHYEQVRHEQLRYDERSRRVEHTANGDVEVMDVIGRDTTGLAYRFRLNFAFQADEAIYGLGSHIEDYMNLRGKQMYLCQHNLKAMVPVLNSTAGYGLLFDAGSAMIYDDTQAHATLQIEAARQLDYYIMKGVGLDAVIANYRWLTGAAPLMPRYLFGYTQSKERYCSSAELLSTLREFRQRRIPIDMIVQDWNYWPQGQWGYMKMDSTYYPDKKALADSVHALHARLMISIWPNAQNSLQYDDFKQRGWIFDGTTVYDAFNPDARRLYWQYANNEFFSQGFDAWWCDSSEPIDGDWGWNLPSTYRYTDHRERWERCTQALNAGLGAERSQLYSLYHARGIYEHQRAQTSAKRVVNLTRSSWAGQQRYATITWNGDTYASWQSFAQMIPAGLNFMATGCPYWSIDIGAFFTKSQSPWFYRGEYPEGCADPAYRELYLRMFQYATFLPVMRSHGSDTPREPWRFGRPGDTIYTSLLRYLHLRYRLLPYIYSLSARISTEGYTLTRALAFDFASDPAVLDLKDEFMFGPAFLVCPVTRGGQTSRPVYLPAGTAWYDFWSGHRHPGGQWIEAPAPLDHAPLYVRAGSIVPMGPEQQYTDELPDAPWEIRIYPGADADFTIYEDAGDGYAYEQGASATYTLHWDDTARELSISGRSGRFDGMAATRRLNVEVVGGGQASVVYTGAPQRIQIAAPDAQPSPNGRLRATSADGRIRIEHRASATAEWLPILAIEADVLAVRPEGTSTVNYEMLTGKRRHCHNQFSEWAYALRGGDTLRLRLFDDGIAWQRPTESRIELADLRHHWLQKWSDSYEDFFPIDRPVGKGERYAYPFLVEYEGGVFALLTESEMTRANAATSLYGTDEPRTFALRPEGDDAPGWQTVVIGSLAEVVGSTLVTDNSAPCRLADTTWIKPGVAAWVYWAYNHGSNDFDIIRRYTDMAAELKLPYVLIDAEWDEMKNGRTIEEAVAYAVERGVRPMIWYNSSVGWINGAPGPKFRLNDPADREREFAWCRSIGVEGVKIDFFGGDSRSNIAYMIDLLESAERHQLHVNFHGVTLPRGWQRTYPHLMTTEAVYGAEWYNNKPVLTDRAAAHNATLPFTRNVVGSMDYTPCAFTDSQHPHITTHAHELALTVLFESGIQHLADRPESFLAQPHEVRDFLGTLPTAWDDTRLLSGYPGHHAVLARRHGDRLYVAGINGTDAHLSLALAELLPPDWSLDLLLTDAPEGEAQPWHIGHQLPAAIQLRARGGFVLVLRRK